MRAGGAEVDVEHDDADHDDHGHQHHAKEQESVGTHSLWSPGGAGRGRAWWAGLAGGVWHGTDITHLPMRGMAMDVAGSLLEMSSRKTD